MILLQGLQDAVVPPDQAEQMASALDAKGIPHAYLAFDGEQHGFRRASSIRRSLEAELYFYSRILGFDLAEQIEPVAPSATSERRPSRGPSGASARRAPRARGRCGPAPELPHSAAW